MCDEKFCDIKFCDTAERYRQKYIAVQQELNQLIAKLQALGYKWEDRRRPI